MQPVPPRARRASSLRSRESEAEFAILCSLLCPDVSKTSSPPRGLVEFEPPRGTLRLTVRWLSCLLPLAATLSCADPCPAANADDAVMVGEPEPPPWYAKQFESRPDWPAVPPTYVELSPDLDLRRPVELHISADTVRDGQPAATVTASRATLLGLLRENASSERAWEIDVRRARRALRSRRRFDALELGALGPSLPASRSDRLIALAFAEAIENGEASIAVCGAGRVWRVGVFEQIGCAYDDDYCPKKFAGGAEVFVLGAPFSAPVLTTFPVSSGWRR